MVEGLKEPMAAVPADIPVVMGVPIAPAALGEVVGESQMSAEVSALLDRLQGFTVKQRVKWIEALTGGCFEQSNTYDVFDSGTGKHIMVAQEDSTDWLRCCCAPTHSLFVKFKPLATASELDGLPAVAIGANGKFPVGVTADSTQSVEAINQLPTAFTMEREGCCSKPCLGCCILSEACSDGYHLHAGDLDKEVNAPGTLKFNGTNVMGFGFQPVPCGGCFTPTLNVLETGNDGHYQPVAKVEGPCIFGGCSELCVKSNWDISSMNSTELKTKLKRADLAQFVKQTPTSLMEAVQEVATDSDTYTMTFSQNVTAQQKAMLLSSLIMVDYMFFEQDIGMLSCEDNKLKITLFECYVGGCLCPCTCTLGGGGEGGDGGGGPPHARAMTGAPVAETGMKR